MEDLKSILLGEAISDALREEGDIRTFPEPPGAPELRRVMGVIGLIMEDDLFPETLTELRERVKTTELTEAEKAHSNAAIMTLLNDGMLEISLDRRLRYNRPMSGHYLSVLEMQ